MATLFNRTAWEPNTCLLSNQDIAEGFYIVRGCGFAHNDALRQTSLNRRLSATIATRVIRRLCS